MSRREAYKEGGRVYVCIKAKIRKVFKNNLVDSKYCQLMKLFMNRIV